MQLIGQGAEGKVYGTVFLSRPTIVKERVSKSYRVKELDQKLTLQRLRQEARCMVKCRRAGVLTPSIFLVDQLNNRLYMERVLGSTTKDILRTSRHGEYPESCLIWAKEIGVQIGRMHDADVVHGDLTTSNIMVQEIDLKVFLIDFGLAMISTVIDDKAVDLYVLERAFISTHPGSQNLVAAIMESYRFTCRKGTLILHKLEQVRQRGRKRDMFG